MSSLGSGATSPGLVTCDYLVTLHARFSSPYTLHVEIFGQTRRIHARADVVCVADDGVFVATRSVDCK